MSKNTKKDDALSSPLVSVITVVRNGAKHIREAMTSVFAQDYPNIEYIVIDGASTDGTQSIVEEYRDKLSYYVSEPDSGIADAWNKGVTASSGDYVAFLNADDYYLPDFIRRSVHMADITRNNIVYGATIVVTESGVIEYVVDRTFNPDRIFLGFGFRFPSCILGRGIFDRVGRFDTSVHIACDTDFLLRCVRAELPFSKSNGVVAMRRGGVSDRYWTRAVNEYLSRLVIHGFMDDSAANRWRRLIPLQLINRKFGIMSKSRWIKDQLFFFGLKVVNIIHSFTPFFLRRALYKICKFDIHPSATIQGSVRFFHVSRLKIGKGSVVNRNVYIDNRCGIRIGDSVSIAHDVRIYTLGHEINDNLFSVKGRSVRIDDHAVIFAGAMIMPGVHIERGAVVLPGSVVSRNVDPFSVVGGNPAKTIGHRDSFPVYTFTRRHWFAH